MYFRPTTNFHKTFFRFKIFDLPGETTATPGSPTYALCKFVGRMQLVIFIFFFAIMQIAQVNDTSNCTLKITL